MQHLNYRHLATLTLGLFMHVAEAAAPSSVDQPAGLEGQRWQLTEYQSPQGLTNRAETGEPARFHFDSGQLSANTGCNQLTGSYRLEGTALAIDKRMAVTQRGCPSALAQQEKALIEALARTTSYRIDQGRLELLDATGQILLTFTLVKTSPLLGRVWQLDRYQDAQKALVPPVARTQIDLTFLERGTLGGSDGCNRYMSGYVLDQQTLKIGPIATTRMACRHTDGRAEQAAAYAAALERVAGFRVAGRSLTLLDSDGSTVASYLALEAPESVETTSPSGR